MIELKKIHVALFVTFLFVIFALCGCSTKLKTSDDAVAYAKIHYGSAEFISEEKDGDSKVVFTLQDKDYGFQYTVTSAVTEMNIDGSSFGKYESTSDDYLSCYRDFILNDSADKFELVRKKYKGASKNPLKKREAA